MPDPLRLVPRPAEQFPESQPEAPERGGESLGFEKSKEAESVSTVLVPPSPAPFVLTEPVVLQKKVEHILEEDLARLYSELNQQDQAKFKILGETTAKKITTLLQQTKFKISEILALIKQWLLSITGINRYFVEQEAKIKAEKILKLRQEK